MPKPKRFANCTQKTTKVSCIPLLEKLLLRMQYIYALYYLLQSVCLTLIFSLFSFSLISSLHSSPTATNQGLYSKHFHMQTYIVLSELHSWYISIETVGIIDGCDFLHGCLLTIYIRTSNTTFRMTSLPYISIAVH